MVKKKNDHKPTVKDPAIVSLVPNVSSQDVWYPELNMMSEECDWDESQPKPMLSFELVKKFLLTCMLSWPLV